MVRVVYHLFDVELEAIVIPEQNDLLVVVQDKKALLDQLLLHVVLNVVRIWLQSSQESARQLVNFLLGQPIQFGLVELNLEDFVHVA